jgi:ubiquinone/menaquinone biosynthesis C-methylase UbiE
MGIFSCYTKWSMSFSFADPASNIAQFGLESGMKIADLGAGTGAYALELAKAVAPAGKVYACEVQKELLTRMRNDATAAHITNIEYLWSNIEKIGGTKLADNSVDGAVISNVLFIVEDRPAFLAEVKRIVKPAGHVYFIDWTDSFAGMGPHPDHIVTRNKAVDLFSQFGFKVEKEFDTGPHHYGVIFKKS